MSTTWRSRKSALLPPEVLRFAAYIFGLPYMTQDEKCDVFYRQGGLVFPEHVVCRPCRNTFRRWARLGQELEDGSPNDSLGQAIDFVNAEVAF